MIEDARAIVLQRIRESFDDDQPTGYALKMAEVLLQEASPLPRASVAPWEDGSLFIYWRQGTRNLHLRVGASEVQSSYVYHGEGDEHGVEYDVTPAKVAEWLRWYAGAFS